MRVLSVGALYPPHDMRGGYELTWRSSVLHLRGRGHDVRVLASDRRSPDLDPAHELDGDVHRELRSYWRDDAFPPLALREVLALERHNGAVLERHLRSQRPDAVAWWQMAGMSLGLVERVRRAGIPAIGVVGNEWLVAGPLLDQWLAWCRSHSRRAALAERLLGLPAGVDLDAAAAWLFNSEATERQARAAGLALPRAEVVHPGVDHDLFALAAPAPPAAWAWRLLYVGRLEERKGVALALEALALLPDEASLVLQGLGAPAYVQELLSRAGGLGVAERVRLSTAPREQLPGIYAAADAVLFPAQWEEPWGLVPLEAMAVGRPVVATGTGGSSEYLRHEENCLIVDPRDSAPALAEAVRRLATEEELRQRLRTGGEQTAARFRASDYDEAIEDALERELAARRPVRR